MHMQVRRMRAIEHGLATAFEFVTKPVGAAVTVAALSAAVGGGLYVKNWWNGIQAKDGTIADLTEQVTDLTGDVRASELARAHDRQMFERREADLQHQVEVADNSATASRSRYARLAQRIEAITHVPADQNGPLAPVLSSALDSVRDELRGLSPVA